MRSGTATACALSALVRLIVLGLAPVNNDWGGPYPTRLSLQPELHRVWRRRLLGGGRSVCLIGAKHAGCSVYEATIEDAPDPDPANRACRRRAHKLGLVRRAVLSLRAVRDLSRADRGRVKIGRQSPRDNAPYGPV